MPLSKKDERKNNRLVLTDRILFIHNPISGGSKHNFLDDFKPFKSKFPLADVKTTTHIGHARELARQFKNVYNIIVAVGGDGTINEIASSLIHSNTSMGIIPYGSANGLAYHLNIPQALGPALDRLVDGKTHPIDIISVGEKIIVNVAGVGFDGHVNNLFNQTRLRGLWSYAKLIFTEYMRFKEFPFKLEVDGQMHEGQAFFIVFANSTQYGHNFHIAPNASTSDGILHVMLISKPPFIMVPYLMFQIFKGKILKSRYCAEVSGRQFTLDVRDQAAHFDGETPAEPISGRINFEVMVNALKVIS
jgi:YegS/Rv2252/BmrU family lipid kinase